MALPQRSLGMFATLACLWEASARKAGNVHPWRDFNDLHYCDLVLSAGAIGPAMDDAACQPVGQTVLQAIRATRALVRTNTNLGIVLLLAPLASVAPDRSLRSGIAAVLENLSIEDSCAVYEAIRLAAPSGLGEVPNQDIRGTPTRPLRQVMALAAERDLIARQYVNDFGDVFDGASLFQKALARDGNLEDAVILTHLHFMASFPDSLISRKCGSAEADEASRRGREVLGAGWPATPKGQHAFAELDAWLTDSGNRRNPGTSADLVAACLFVALREGIMTLPVAVPWSAASGRHTGAGL